MEGNGDRGFSTPLATLHAFNGFADVFLTTPEDGLKDLYLKAVVPVGGKLKATAVFHEFRFENTSGRVGRELDLVVGYKINEHLSATGKFARYEGTSRGTGIAGANVTKFWLQIDARY